MRQVGAQLIEDGEAVGVEIAPVMDFPLAQPGGFGQGVETVAGAEDDQTAGRRGKARKLISFSVMKTRCTGRFSRAKVRG